MEEAKPPGRARGSGPTAATKSTSATRAPRSGTPKSGAAKSGAVKRAGGKAPTKAAPTKAAEPAAETMAPVEPSAASPPAPAPGPEPSPAPLWAQLAADPRGAPDRVAREAVRRLGPVAGEWAARMRVRYPDASADGLARLAILHCVQQARRGCAAAGLAGASGALAGAGALAHTRAGLVLRIAAAYGLDPASDERVGELLALMRVPHRGEPGRTTATKLARMLTGLGVWETAARLMPLGRVVAGAVAGARATADVGARAMAHYRTRPGSAQKAHPAAQRGIAQECHEIQHRVRDHQR